MPFQPCLPTSASPQAGEGGPTGGGWKLLEEGTNLIFQRNLYSTKLTNVEAGRDLRDQLVQAPEEPPAGTDQPGLGPRCPDCRVQCSLPCHRWTLTYVHRAALHLEGIWGSAASMLAVDHPQPQAWPWVGSPSTPPEGCHFLCVPCCQEDSRQQTCPTPNWTEKRGPPLPEPRLANSGAGTTAKVPGSSSQMPCCPRAGRRARDGQGGYGDADDTPQPSWRQEGPQLTFIESLSMPPS